MTKDKVSLLVKDYEKGKAEILREHEAKSETIFDKYDQSTIDRLEMNRQGFLNKLPKSIRKGVSERLVHYDASYASEEVFVVQIMRDIKTQKAAKGMSM